MTANTILSLAQSTPTGHLPFYQHRPINNLFQNVITNSMALNAAARDKGRHRSGSSVSSSDGGLFAFNHSDLTSPPSGTARPMVSAANTCTTYPGRGTIVPGTQTLGNALRTVHPSGKTQPARLNINKKLSGSIPQQQQHQPTALGTSSFITDRASSLGTSALMQDTSSGHPIRSLMLPDHALANATGGRSVGSHPSQPVAPVPSLQNTLWATESMQPDRLIGSSGWPWHVTIDSGHNSEASITDSNELGPGAYDLSTTGTVVSSVPFGMVTHGLDSTSQRDSGLVLDFALPAMGDQSTDSSLTGTGRPTGLYRSVAPTRDQFSSEFYHCLLIKTHCRSRGSDPVHTFSGSFRTMVDCPLWKADTG
ncbi:unnamed protein product [Echinostoma caproni]|uniref:Uncharacterized protein n=1 Tax=Echinostoma caproni TaxID=27848 RepID=A0A3P8HK47_9TREM|nr:unnamed protein product [Echinostoma caproni]